LGSIPAPFGVNQPVDVTSAIERSGRKENGKREDSSLGTVWCRSKKSSMYIRVCATLGNTFVSDGAGLDQFQLLFGEPTSRFTSAIECSRYGRKVKIATARRHSLVRLKEVHPIMYIRMRVLQVTLFC
jgi:hypothetical protein